jgi:hypothetical protein
MERISTFTTDFLACGRQNLSFPSDNIHLKANTSIDNFLPIPSGALCRESFAKIMQVLDVMDG